MRPSADLPIAALVYDPEGREDDLAGVTLALLAHEALRHLDRRQEGRQARTMENRRQPRPRLSHARGLRFENDLRVHPLSPTVPWRTWSLRS